MDVIFELATAADDAAIRRILRTNPLSGGVTVTYEREPNYFLGCGTMGRSWEVVVARRQTDGEVVGFGCRAVRPHFVNGRMEQIGYLSQLRVDRPFRGTWLPSRGFRFLHQLHIDRPAPAYLATITEENTDARGILVDHPPRHFPAFREVDRLHTLALIVRPPRALPASPYDIARGSSADLGAIIAFLREHGAAKQFFPAYEVDDFGGGSATRGFRVDDFIVARSHGEIAGVIGLWDQSAYKQMVVQAYGGFLRRARPLYNAGVRLMGAQLLPEVGQAIRSIYASFVCIAGNDPDIFRVLLRSAYNLAARRGYAYLLIGLSVRDPLLAIARRYAHITYRSRLYLVCWQDGEGFHERLDNRVPYVDVATL